MIVSTFNTSFLIYLLTFGTSALVCFLAASKTNKIEEPETRKGLFYLLTLSGGWAASHFGYLIFENNLIKLSFYNLGLVLGLMAVGAWIYFCSAYTNRTLHRNKTFKKIAYVSFGFLIVIKLTNPLHGLYYSVNFLETPFAHLAIHNKLLHWLTMGLSYSICFVGYFMIIEKLDQTSYNQKPLLFLMGITSLPLVFDILGYSTSFLIDITYEPIGVAIFGVGVLSVFYENFRTIQIAGAYEDPIIVLDKDNRIKEYNQKTKQVFPSLNNKKYLGQKLEEGIPQLDKALEKKSKILELDKSGKKRYYQVSLSPFSAERTQLGKIVVFSDITKRKKAEKREEFLHSLLRHDVQNKNQVIEGYLELLKEIDLDDDIRKKIQKALNATLESEEIIEKVRTLSKIEEEQNKEVNLKKILDEVVEEKRDLIEDKEIKIDLNYPKNSLKVKAGPLLKEVYSNLLENAINHAKASKIEIKVAEEGNKVVSSVEDDGIGIPKEKRQKVFKKGYKGEKTGKTGLGLYLVQEIIRQYEGKVEVEKSELGGAKFTLFLNKT